LNIPHTIDGPCEITTVIDSLVTLAETHDLIAEEEPQEALLLRVAGLALISQLCATYGQEYFSFEEINFIEDLSTALSSGEHDNEQFNH